ncbi:MAG: hypothetical protein WKF74_00935 [Pyrinomonadaceae bacterium]
MTISATKLILLGAVTGALLGSVFVAVPLMIRARGASVALPRIGLVVAGPLAAAVVGVVMGGLLGLLLGMIAGFIASPLLSSS